MTSILLGVSWLCVSLGAVVTVIGTVGLLRMPDFYTRIHAVGITDTLGAGLILSGMVLQAGLSMVTVKLLLIIVFMILTNPTATHALAKSAKHGNLEPLLDEDMSRSPSSNK